MDLMSMVLIMAAIFVLAPVVIVGITLLILRSARRRDGTIDWRRLGNGDL